jgi:hypothetical protein
LASAVKVIVGLSHRINFRKLPKETEPNLSDRRLLRIPFPYLCIHVSVVGLDVS